MQTILDPSPNPPTSHGHKFNLVCNVGRGNCICPDVCGVSRHSQSTSRELKIPSHPPWSLHRRTRKLPSLAESRFLAFPRTDIRFPPPPHYPLPLRQHPLAPAVSTNPLLTFSPASRATTSHPLTIYILDRHTAATSRL